MAIYYVLLAVAIIIVALVIMLVIIIIKNLEKDEPQQEKVQQKDDGVKWNHIKDFVDINSNRNGLINNYNELSDEDVMTTGVSFAMDKKMSAPKPPTNDNFNNEFRKEKDYDTQSMDSTIYEDTQCMPCSLPHSAIDVTLNYNDGNGSKVLKMTSDKLTVGRDMSNDLILWNNIYLSRWHAEFVIRDNRLYLKDLNSKNGTYLDAKPVKGEVELTDNCEVKFGSTVISVSIEKNMNI